MQTKKANETFFNIFLKNLCIFKSEYIHSNSILRHFLYNWDKTNYLSLFLILQENAYFKAWKIFFRHYTSCIICWIYFQSRQLQAYYKRGLSVVWGRHVLTGNRYLLTCGSSRSNLFFKIDTPKNETKSLKNTLKEVSFQ